MHQSMNKLLVNVLLWAVLLFLRVVRALKKKGNLENIMFSFCTLLTKYAIMQKVLERAANCVCCEHVKRQTVIFAIV